jgi:hypothetical protein
VVESGTILRNFTYYMEGDGGAAKHKKDNQYYKKTPLIFLGAKRVEELYAECPDGGWGGTGRFPATMRGRNERGGTRG